MFDFEDYIANFFVFPKPEAHKLWAEEYEEMSVHTRGKLPKKLIKERRPFEDEGIYEYRLKTFEPITKDAIDRAIINLQRIFTKSAVDYEMPDDLRQYLDLNHFEGYNFWTYIQKKPLRRMIEDPNGVLVWWPTGRGVNQNNEEVNVNPHMILSKNIRHFNDHVFSWKSNENSKVEGDKGNEYTGEVHYIVTEDAFWKLVQVGRKGKGDFELVKHYQHNLGYLPTIVLGGEETSKTIENKNTELPYRQSYFNSYKAFANEAIRQFSDHQAIMVNSAYPIREMEPLDCTNPKCNDGWIVRHGQENETCDTCHGKGYLLPSSPYGVMIRKKTINRPGEKEESYRPALVYHSPDVGICKYSGEHWEKLLAKAEKSLNLLFIDEAQSGKAKEIDREDKKSQLDRIGDNVVLNIIVNSIRVINGLRRINSTDTEIVASLPDTFKIKSEDELMDELSTMVEKKVPEFMVSETMKDVIRRKYGQNRSLLKIVEVISSIDPYFAYPIAEKQSLFASTVMKEEEMLISIHAPRILNRIAIEKGADFVTMSIDDLEKEVRKEIKPMVGRGMIDPNGENV